MPRSKEQFQEMRENSKKIILDAALKLFSSYGFHAVTINKIAKEAKIATGLVYNYFDSKEELFEEIVKCSIDEFNTVLYAKSKKMVESNDLVRLIEVMFETIKNNIDSWKLFVRIFLQSDLDIEKRSMGMFFDDLYKVSKNYFENKGMNNSETESRLLLELLHGTILSFIISENEETFEFTKSQLINKFL